MDELVEYKGGWVRKNLAVDKNMINDCLKHYKNFDDLENAIVMDWGMNIGGLGLMMKDKPISKYIGIECHPENFLVARMNLLGSMEKVQDDKFTPIRAAVTGLTNVNEIYLHLTGSKQALCSGTINLKSDRAGNNRKERIKVPAVNAQLMLELYAPTHLKCDVEGEEYRIFDDINWQMPKQVKQLAMEFHWADRILTYETDIRPKLLEQGFVPDYEKLNYVKGETLFTFLGKNCSYRNIWGLDCFYRR